MIPTQTAQDTLAALALARAGFEISPCRFRWRRRARSATIARWSRPA
ncbi:MAG: hypothetical protein VB138_13500 [Burkholderia sp.]